MSPVHRQDEEDQAYIMDETGNFEPSQTPNNSERPVEAAAPDAWGDEWDDQEYLESVNEFEEISGEISDQLLLTCVDDGCSQ